MDVKEAYKVMQENCGIEVGDTVRVLREAKSHEMGWSHIWVITMNEFIGNELKVISLDNGAGIQLSNDYYFPFFVLKLTRKAKKINLNGSYTVVELQKIIDENK
jgi:hypothetical protein